MVRFVIALVLLAAASTVAEAKPKPKVAVTPIEGDSNDKLANVVADALAEDAKVTSPKETGRAMAKLDLSGELSAKDVKKLRTKLGVAVVVQGTLEKDGSKRILHLVISARGKPTEKFSAEYKTMPGEKVRRALRTELVKRIEANDQEDQDEPEKPKRDPDADKPKRDPDADKPKRDPDADKPKRRIDEDKPKRRVAEDDKDRSKKKKKKKKKDEPEHEPMTDARVAAGASAGVRRLTYSSPTPPPRVGTFAPAARVDAEIYPFALTDPSSTFKNLGITASYQKTIGLKIDIAEGSVPIDQADYSAGVRLRIPVGISSVVGLGVSFVGRHYIADRSALMVPTLFDAPDVDYKAIAPSLSLRTPVSPTMAFFARADALLILDTGAIQNGTNYGAATVYGFDVTSGLDFVISPRFDLCLGADFLQINLKFKGKGDMATARGVTAAVDRSLILLGTLGVTY